MSRSPFYKKFLQAGGNASGSIIVVAMMTMMMMCSHLVVMVDAYRMGEAVDTIIWTSFGSDTAARTQQPLFGISKSTTIPRPRTKFSMGFEDGLHALRWTGGKELETLEVTFVYSKSSGLIHSVSSNSIYSKPITVTGGTKFNPNINIQYIWIEEEPIDMYAGGSVMFLATLIASIVFLVRACMENDGSSSSSEGSDGDDDYDGDQYAHHHREY